MTDTDPAQAGLSDPRLARQPAQNRSQGRMVERVLIVQVDFGDLDLDEAVQEVRMLAESAGACVCAEIEGKRQSPDAATFAGKGKVAEIAAEIAAARATRRA